MFVFVTRNFYAFDGIHAQFAFNTTVHAQDDLQIHATTMQLNDATEFTNAGKLLYLSCFNSESYISTLSHLFLVMARAFGR